MSGVNESFIKSIPNRPSLYPTMCDENPSTPKIGKKQMDEKIPQNKITFSKAPNIPVIPPIGIP